MADHEISVAEAARRLRVDLNYVYSLLWAGKLKACKIGGQWRISTEAIDARLKQRGE